MLRRIAVAFVLLAALVLAPWRAHAQRGDVYDGPAAGLTVPPLPEDHVVERHGPLRISYPRAMRSVVAGALARGERDARALAAQFGIRDIPTLDVRLVADAAALRALAPREVPPPAYAVGVAYAPVRLALVSAAAPRTWEASNMAQVLRHELSHLLLAEATHHAVLPRWFAEGIAVQQSDEHTFERFQELASASWTGRVLPLARLDEGFVEGPDAVNVAYAQSADFMGWLVRREGAARFAVMLEHVRDGASLDNALRETYGVGIAPLEGQWKQDLDGRVAFAPIWAGTGLMSVLGVLFVVVAMVRRWRRNKAIRAKWDREESAARSRWLFAARPSLRLVRSPEDDRPLLH